MPNPVETILHECVAINGFLSKLREGEFSESNYKSLLNALGLYRDAIKGQNFIDRSVAYCLYYLELGVSNAVKYYPKSTDEKQFIDDIYIECSSIIIDIVTPDKMTGPLPEKFLT